MSDLAEDPDDLELDDIQDDIEPEEPDDDTDQGDDEDEPDPEDGLAFTFEDEAAPASGERDTSLIRKLRAELRESNRRLAQVSRAPEVEPIQVGIKPTLEGCGYDEAVFDEEYDRWNLRKAQAAAQAEASQKAEEANKAAWADEMAAYEGRKKALGVKDFQASEEEVSLALSELQQVVLIKASDDNARLIYALGRSPAKLAEIAKIQDPFKLAAAVAKLEGQLKVTKTSRKPPAPDEAIRGSAPASPGNDRRLKQLEADAEKTGDRTALIRYKKAAAQAK
jgi:hypothetical protein